MVGVVTVTTGKQGMGNLRNAKLRKGNLRKPDAKWGFALG